MARYTVQYDHTCTGGGHIVLRVLQDGKPVRLFSVTREQIMDTDLSWEEVLPFFLREAIKRSGATTLAQARDAIEAASWEF